MLIRVAEDAFVPVVTPLSFGQWMAQGHQLGWPTFDDLHYHVTTLFPPVRAKGWLELRMIDALQDPWWRVALAVSAALLDTPDAGERVDAITATVVGRWEEAARLGL